MIEPRIDNLTGVQSTGPLSEESSSTSTPLGESILSVGNPDRSDSNNDSVQVSYTNDWTNFGDDDIGKLNSPKSPKKVSKKSTGLLGRFRTDKKQDKKNDPADGAKPKAFRPFKTSKASIAGSIVVCGGVAIGLSLGVLPGIVFGTIAAALYIAVIKQRPKLEPAPAEKPVPEKPAPAPEKPVIEKTVLEKPAPAASPAPAAEQQKPINITVNVSDINNNGNSAVHSRSDKNDKDVLAPAAPAAQPSRPSAEASTNVPNNSASGDESHDSEIETNGIDISLPSSNGAKSFKSSVSLEVNQPEAEPEPDYDRPQSKKVRFDMSATTTIPPRDDSDYNSDSEGEIEIDKSPSVEANSNSIDSKDKEEKNLEPEPISLPELKNIANDIMVARDKSVRKFSEVKITGLKRPSNVSSKPTVRFNPGQHINRSYLGDNDFVRLTGGPRRISGSNFTASEPSNINSRATVKFSPSQQISRSYLGDNNVVRLTGGPRRVSGSDSTASVKQKPSNNNGQSYLVDGKVGDKVITTEGRFSILDRRG